MPRKSMQRKEQGNMYKTIVIKYSPKANEMAAKIEEKVGS